MLKVGIVVFDLLTCRSNDLQTKSRTISAKYFRVLCHLVVITRKICIHLTYEIVPDFQLFEKKRIQLKRDFSIFGGVKSVELLIV